MSIERTTIEKYRHETSNLSRYNFDFSGCDTQYLTHGFHGYPARMPPQIAKTILNHYLREQTIEPGDVVYDPFAGSGTTGVEAQLVGLNAVLVDLNPLATLIARTKTTKVPTDRIYRAWQSLNQGNECSFDQTISESFNQISSYYEQNEEVPVKKPEVSTRYEWFPKPQLYHLSHLQDRIDEVEKLFGNDVGQFFRTVLSTVCRDVSYQRNGEYKRYRIPQEQWEKHDPDVLELFTTELANNVEKIGEFNSAVRNSSEVEVHTADSRKVNFIESNSADIVVTSPPYGDHDTTVPYGQYSLDPAVISMGVSRDAMKNVDKKGLGGTAEPLDSLRSYSSALDQTITELRSRDGRASDALSFFTDYFQVLKEIRRILKPGQPVVFVVANRHMSDTLIPTHHITMELLQELGFQEEDMVPRTLPYKTLPQKNSPSNVVGETGEMMSEEYIVAARNQVKQPD